MEIYCRTCEKLVAYQGHIIDCKSKRHDILDTCSLQTWKERGARTGYIPYLWEPRGGLLGKILAVHDDWRVEIEGLSGAMQLFPSYVIFVQK